jgi:PST family polysaccharide transporter
MNRATAFEFVLGLSLLVLIVPFGLAGVGLAISLTALVIGVYWLVLAGPVVGVRPGQVIRATLPTVVAGLVAAAATAALEHLLLLSDSRPMFTALAFLALDGLAYLVVYVAALGVVAPAMIVTMVRAALVAGRRLRRVTARR